MMCDLVFANLTKKVKKKKIQETFYFIFKSYVEKVYCFC